MLLVCTVYNRNMFRKQLQAYGFLACLAVAFVIAFLVIKPVLVSLVFGLITAIVLRPLYWKLKRIFPNPALRAMLCTLLVALVVILPLILFGQLIYNELNASYRFLQGREISLDQESLVQLVPQNLQELALKFNADLNGLLAKFANSIFNTFSHVLTNAAQFTFNFFLVLFSAYFFLKDGTEFRKVVSDLSPISTEQEAMLFRKVSQRVRGLMLGTFLLALIQGLLACVGFLATGVPNPILWGSVTIIAAIIPGFGTALVVGPAVAYLLITGHTILSLILLGWGILVVGLIDNFLGPRIVGKRADLHPVLVLFGVLGGLQFFGFLGFILGPVTMAVLVAFIELYRTDFLSFMESL